MIPPVADRVAVIARRFALPARGTPPNRALLAVGPICRAAYAAAAGNQPLVRVYAREAAPWIGALANTAIVAVEAAIEDSGLLLLAEGLRLENAVLRSEASALRRELAVARAALRRAA